MKATAKGASGYTAEDFRAYRHTVAVRPAVQVIKAIHCFAYQARNVSDWESCWAKRVCDALERAAVNALPGYDEAPWGID
jgi:hypothetical protein